MYLNFTKLLSFLAIFLFFANSLFGQETPPELKSRYEQSVLKVKTNEIDVPDTLSVVDLLKVGDSFNLALKNSYGVNLDVLADQVTSTNTARDFWRFAREPRESILNGSELTTELYTSFLEAQIEANNMHVLLTDSSKIVFLNGEDITVSSRANVILLRGIIKAYLGLIYDQGVLVDSLGFLKEYSIEGLQTELVPYETLIESGLFDIEAAIDMVTEINEEDYNWKILPTPSEISKSRFLKIAHSMIAKILISSPRSSTETIDYGLVLEHAQKGLDDEYPNIIIKTRIIENPNGVSPR